MGAHKENLDRERNMYVGIKRDFRRGEHVENKSVAFCMRRLWEEKFKPCKATIASSRQKPGNQGQ